jgi:exosome complex component RRP46
MLGHNPSHLWFIQFAHFRSHGDSSSHTRATMTLAMKPARIEQGVLTRSDGSARYTTGDTAVLASLNGPQEVSLRKELLNQATLEINVLPLRGLPSPDSKLAARSLHTVLSSLILLHLHPKSLIQLTLQTVSLPTLRFHKPFQSFAFDEAPFEDDNAFDAVSCVELATLLNASVIALLDAGISMKATASAVGVALLPTGELALDPTLQQERDAVQCMVVSYAFASALKEGGELVWCETTKG